MPKYFENKVYGYYLYFTSFCIVEAMHVHASEKGLKRQGSAKFFVENNGDTIVKKKGDLSDRDIMRLQKFIKLHYEEMYDKWSKLSENGYYGEE